MRLKVPWPEQWPQSHSMAVLRIPMNQVKDFGLYAGGNGRWWDANACFPGQRAWSDKWHRKIKAAEDSGLEEGKSRGKATQLLMNEEVFLKI